MQAKSSWTLRQIVWINLLKILSIIWVTAFATDAFAQSISSVSPSTYPASSSNQSMTINGSGFVSGATLVFDPPTGSNLNSTASRLSFVSSSRIDYQFNNGSDAGTWTVRVKNPNGQQSATKSFTVTAVASPPSISSVSPSTYPASSSTQSMTINGSGFVNGATLVFDPPTGSNISSTASRLSFVSSSRIDYQFNNGSDAGTWTVRVNNPNGQQSGTRSFTVTAVASPPSISSVSPSTYPASGSTQSMTINGSGFVNGATLVFDPPSGSNISSTASRLSFVSSSRIDYQFNNGSDAGTWTVRVNNPDGQQSGTRSFTVTAVASPPSISSVSPSTYPASGSTQSMTINGSGFVNGATLVFDPPSGSNISSTASRLSFVSSSRIDYQFNNGSDAGTWTVRVNNPNGQQSGAASFTVQSPAPTKPAQPTNLQPGTTSSPGPTTSGSTVTISWSPSSGATNYLYGIYDLSSGTEVFKAGAETPATSATHTLLPGRAYSWRVTACNGAASTGLCSNFTADLYFRTPDAPPPTRPAQPTNLLPGTTSSPGPTQPSSTVTISWTPSSGATNYVYGIYDLSSGTPVLAAGDTTPATSATHTLQPGRTYNWRIIACNGSPSAATCSGFTTELYFRTPGSGPVGPAPKIQGIAQEALYTSTNAQPLTIHGVNFGVKSGANIILRSFNDGRVFPARKSSEFSSNQITINPVFGPTPERWSVQIVTDSGGPSEPFEFDVVERPRPNLRVESQFVTFSPPAVTPGQGVAVVARVNNLGNAPSPASKIRFSLSTDRIADAYDLPLDLRDPSDGDVPSIPAGAFHPVAVNLRVPDGTPPDTYFIVVTADPGKNAGESNNNDDSGVSSASLQISSVLGVPPPQITGTGFTCARSPNGRAATLIVEAKGAGPLGYQWERLNNDGTSAFKSAVKSDASMVVRTAGKWRVHVNGSGGSVVSGECFVEIEPIPLVSSSDASGKFEDGPVIDSTRPTVIIVHGWHDTDAADAGDFPQPWTISMQSAVLERVSALGEPQRPNVLRYTWPNAKQNKCYDARKWVYDEGAHLASLIADQLGRDGNSRGLHLIGHSFGSAVVTYAADALKSFNYQNVQVTILDAPIDLVAFAVPFIFDSEDCQFEREFYSKNIPTPTVVWVDNYYGRAGNQAVGDTIEGSAPNKGLRYVDANHCRVHDRYCGTINNRSCESLCPDTEQDELDEDRSTENEGFDFSIVLGEPFASNRPAPKDWEQLTAEPAAASEDISSTIKPTSGTFEVLLDKVRGTFGRVYGLSTSGLSPGLRAAQGVQQKAQARSQISSSDSIVESQVFVPDYAVDLRLDLLFSEPGDGSLVTIRIAGEEAFKFVGENFIGDEYRDIAIPVSQFAGTHVPIEVILQKVGTSDATVRIANLRFTGEETLVDPVPTPDTTPDAFGFAAIGNVPVGSAQTSGAVTITGINAPAEISVVNGLYSVGCTGTFASDAGVINDGQSVCVRHTAFGSSGATMTTLLTIGGVTGNFSTTTAAAPPPAVNTIQNSGFEGSTLGPWFFFAAGNALGTSAIDSAVKFEGTRSVRIDITRADTAAPWNATLAQAVNLVAGRTYTLSFRAMAGRVRPIRAVVQLDRSPYTAYFGQTPSLDTTWKEFTYTFTASVTTGATLNFNLGQSIGSVWFDSVSLSNGTPTPPADTTPNAFSFTDVTGVSVNSVLTSNAITITGIDAPAAVSISGGTYSLGCTSSFVDIVGTITNGQTVCVRHTAAAAAGAGINTTLTVGGVSDTFTSTTAGAMPPPPIPGNFIVNPGFETGSLSPWFFYATGNALGTSAIDSAVKFDGSRSARINITRADTAAPWNATLAQAVSLVAGQTYTLRFRAMADRARPIRAVVQLDRSPYTGYFSQSPALNATWGEFVYTFTSPVTVSATLSFNVGQSIGSVWFDSVSLSSGTSTPSPDTTPNSFSFTDVTGVSVNSVQTSSAVTITGIDAPAPVSISGGTYSLGCTSSFVDTAGTITNGQTVCVRHTAAAAAGAGINTTLTVGGVSDIFTSTTAGATPPPPIPGNLIVNSGFETGSLSPWFFYATGNALGTSAIDSAVKFEGSRSARINITRADTAAPWNATLAEAVNLVAGQTYTLRFRAMADRVRSIGAVVQLNRAPYTAYLSQSPALNTTWKEFTFTFTAPVTTGGILSFNLGQSVGNVWFDAVTLQ
ncbi:MAG: carbohydrate binding domain-containing protein [Panacagrimonas sp.]